MLELVLLYKTHLFVINLALYISATSYHDILIFHTQERVWEQKYKKDHIRPVKPRGVSWLA